MTADHYHLDDDCDVLVDADLAVLVSEGVGVGILGVCRLLGVRVMLIDPLSLVTFSLHPLLQMCVCCSQFLNTTHCTAQQGAPLQRYTEYAVAVRQEYSHLNDADYCAGRWVGLCRGCVHGVF